MKQNKIRKIGSDTSGSTLAEVIVTFALTGMFLLATVTAVSAAMNAFYRMEAISQAIVVSDIILNKAQSELSPAMADGASLCLGGSQTDDGWWDTICFYTANGSPVCMKSEDPGDGKNIFLLYYYPVKNADADIQGGVSWTFDKKLYQGFWIKDLSFRWNGTADQPDNIIEIRLELTSGTASYSQTRYVQCMNFFRRSHFARIHTGEVFTNFTSILQK